MERLVFSDGSGVIEMSAGNVTNIADVEILGDMTVGNCMTHEVALAYLTVLKRSDYHQADLRQVIPFFFECLLTFSVTECAVQGRTSGRL